MEAAAGPVLEPHSNVFVRNLPGEFNELAGSRRIWPGREPQQIRQLTRARSSRLSTSAAGSSGHFRSSDRLGGL